MARTRIVATLGPATDPPGVLEELIRAGLNVARLNASHGTQADHLHRLERVRAASAEQGQNVAVMLDLQGPKIRVGELPPDGIELAPGQPVALTNRPAKEIGPITGEHPLIAVDYEPLPREVQAGHVILLDDGNLALRVERTDGTTIEAVVERGGKLTSHKGINVPGAALNAPALTEKDLGDVAFGVQHQVDYFAMSFVRRAADIAWLRELCGDAGIIAKMERPEAMNELEGILKAADGIMVARGDLGVEVPLEDVPALQRRMLEAANRMGKPAITATQMLESMISHGRPTRAEATDVHMAVLQLTDAVMLSAETATGQYPVEAVCYMDRIATAAERAPELSGHHRAKAEIAGNATEAVAQAACEIATELNARAIVTSTSSGTTPRMVAKYRPQMPIIALAAEARVRQRLALTWGVRPIASPRIRSTDELLETASRLAMTCGVAAPGDLIVITAGVPAGTPGHTNLIKVHRIGDPTTYHDVQ